MKYSFAFILLCLYSCNTNKDIPTTNNSNLFQSWKHSYEEDTQVYKVYRNVAFNFPPARGRDAFEIKEDGVFIHHQIGPVDVPVTVEKGWEWRSDNILFVVREQ